MGTQQGIAFLHFLRLHFVHAVALCISSVALAGDQAVETRQAKKPTGCNLWAWESAADDHRQPRPAYREITRQMVAESYKLAERGDVEGAIQLARRAKWLVLASPQSVPTHRNPDADAPTVLLRQLEAMRNPRRHNAPWRLSSPDEPDSNAEARPSEWNRIDPLSGRGASPIPVGVNSGAKIGSDILDGPEALNTGETKPADGTDASVGAQEDGTGRPIADRSGQFPRQAASVAGDARIRAVMQADEKQPPHSTSWLATAVVQLISTLAGSLFGLLIIGAALYFIVRRYGEHLGPVFKVELVNSQGPGLPGVSAAALADARPSGTAEATMAGHSGLPISVEPQVSLFEEEMRAAEEAERAMLKHVLEQNIRLREEIFEVQESAASRSGGSEVLSCASSSAT